jgi:methyl-accepting chemotaxis protein
MTHWLRRRADVRHLFTDGRHADHRIRHAKTGSLAMAHPLHRVLASKGRCSVTDDLTVRILTDIRDGVRETNARLDQTRDELSSRIDALTQRVVESEIRTATALTDVASTVREVATLLREQGDLRPRVERCERQIAALERRRRG